MNALYLESSAILRCLLEGDVTIIKHATADMMLITSALTGVEVERSLLKAFRDKRITSDDRRAKRQWFHDLQQATEIITLDTSILERAGQSFPVEPIRTLDALHLASAILFEQATGQVLSILSVDDRVRDNAEELGFQVLPHLPTQNH